MKTLLGIALTLLFTFHSANAQDWARRRLESSVLPHQWVTITGGPRNIQAFIAAPANGQKGTVVVLVHGALGMTDWIRSTADRLAEAGYVAVVPDLLSGSGPDGGATETIFGDNAIRTAVYHLDEGEVFKDLDVVMKYASNHPQSNGKMAIAGFSWGGTEAFRFIRGRSDIKAAFIFHAICLTSEKDINQIQVPVFGYFSAGDTYSYPSVAKCAEISKYAKKTFVNRVYEGSGQHFMFEGELPDAKPADKKSRDTSWQSFLDELKKL